MNTDRRVNRIARTSSLQLFMIKAHYAFGCGEEHVWPGPQFLDRQCLGA